jgi:hypothetical protein
MVKLKVLRETAVCGAVADTQPDTGPASSIDVLCGVSGGT